MSRIRLSLLGTPRIERDGELIALDRHKAFALLVFLAITNERHRRDTLAALLWPDYDQTRARAAVRRALASLNKAIPGAWWDADRETIGLSYKAPLLGDDQVFWLDVDQFHARLAECQTHGHPIADICLACLNPLGDAVTLYRGDFLSGFTLRDSPNFDDWQFDQTESLRRDLSGALERLARLHAVQGNFDPAIGYSRRWLSLDPWNELAHRQLMYLFAQSGKRHAALRQYAECVRVLERELGVPPQEETTQLFEAIKADQLPAMLTQWTVAQGTSVAHEGYSTPQTKLIVEPPREKFDSPQTATPRERATPLFERLIHGQLIGRESELERVNATWRRVDTGEARVLLVSGEPGIGKTRLAREIIEMTKASGADVLECQCHAQDSAPYEPIAQIIRGILNSWETITLPNLVLADLMTLTPDLAFKYPNLPTNHPLDAQSEQRRLFESVTSLIASLAQTTQVPLLMCIEDVHWADTGSLFLLRHLAQKANILKLKLLILITYRDAESDLNEARGLRDILLDLNREQLADHLRLSCLDREHTSDLLAMMLGTKGEISADFLDAIFGETEGNPFFIEEVCKALIEAGKLYYVGGHWRADMESINLPQNVRSAILTRVEKLPLVVQEVLKLAAIFGREFDFETIKSASESDEATLRSSLERAERTQLIHKIESEGRLMFTFVHALIPFALRESIGGLGRQQMHARVAEALEGQRPDDVEALAHHFVAAGARAKAVEYSRQAAGRAERMYAYNSAIRHLLVALEMLEAREDVHSHITILEGLADLHNRLNEGAHAIPIYLEALQLWRGLTNADIWIAVRLQRKIGEVATSMNRFSDYQRFAVTARSSLEAALTLIQGQAPHLETVRLLRTLSRNSRFIVSSADWEAAERYAQAAVTMAEQLDAPEEVSSALESLAAVYGARGLFREGVGVCLRRLDLSHDPGFGDYRERANVLYELGRALLSVGEYEAALSYAVEAENLSNTIQDVTSQVNAMILQSHCLFQLNRWDDLLAMDEKLRDIQARNAFERLGIAMCFHTALHSAVKALRGDRERADVLREEAYGIMVAIGGPPEGWVRNQHF